jgi:hypothetical protein
MDDLADLVAMHFIRNQVAVDKGIRMVGTLLAYMALESGLSASDFGQAMAEIHQSMRAT